MKSTTLLRLSFWLAFFTLGLKEPTRLKIFFSEGYESPEAEMMQTDVVVNLDSIALREYSVDRVGDCYIKHFSSFRDLIQKCSMDRISLISTFYGSNLQMEEMTLRGRRHSADELLKHVHAFKEREKCRIETFLQSLRFRIIESI